MGTPTVAVGGQSIAGTHAADDAREAAALAPRRSRIVHTAAIIVLVIGLALTAVLSLGARSIHDNNEDRLLHQRAREVGAVLGAALSGAQAPLQAAALLAGATGGQRAQFEQLAQSLMKSNATFVSISLWSRNEEAAPLVVTGSAPALASETPADIRTFLGRVGTDKLAIHNMLNNPDRRLGYAIGAPDQPYLVYAEAALPKDRRATVDKNSAFSDLGYALYLGSKADPAQLIASSNAGGVLRGRTSGATVDFGDAKLHIVLTPRKDLGGTLLARLPWILAIAGALLTLLVAALVERLTLQRRNAQRLAHENAHLYLAQRSIAQTLQHSLLPEALPHVEGLEFAARYVAGVQGVDIGGDWYDVIPIDDDHLVLIVGDVSGCGLQSATMMASLRFAARAYAIQGDAPATILSKLSNMVSIARDGHFATLICLLVDVPARALRIANAGHPEPLVVSGNEGSFVKTEIGVPIGVNEPKPRQEVTVTVPSRSTLLMYTDGLVERRGELLDAGLERLKQAAVGADGSLESVVDTVLREAIPSGSDDDTAILGVRWLN